MWWPSLVLLGALLLPLRTQALQAPLWLDPGTITGDGLRLAQGTATPTTEQLFRELTNLRTILETRLDGMDKEMAQSQALTEEKFRGLDTRLVAARSALASVQEAAEKLYDQAQRAQEKQLDQVTAGQRDLKERLDRLEGQASGVGTSWGVIIGLVGLAGGLLALVAGLRRKAA
jgi:hypothetical protein